MSNTTESIEKKIVMDAYNPVGLPVPEGFDLNQMIGEYIDQANPNKKIKYMPASARIAWFRRNEPDSSMPLTDFISDKDGIVVYRATLFDKSGKVRAVATGADSLAKYPQGEAHKAYETAETRAIGRCLRFLGYGIGTTDEGDEKEPIDNASTTEPVKSINEMIDSDEDNKPNNTPSSTAATNANTKTFADMTDLEKGVAAILTPFPIGFTITGVNYKGKELNKIIIALKKSGTSKNPAEDIQKKLNWGLDNGMKAELNAEIQLAYPEYANFVIAMLNDPELYKKANSEVKAQIYAQKENNTAA